MIIDITDKCTMQCIHCLQNCKPSNNSMMNEQTLINILENSLFVSSKAVLVSGGEPTEHPEFFEIMNKILKYSCDKTVSILSNGLWANSQKMVNKMTYLADKPNVGIQVTNDKAFYPVDVKRVPHSSIYYEEKLRILDYLGRGKNLSINDYPHVRRRVGPMCFNMRSILHRNNVGSIVTAVRMLEIMGKFCTVMFMSNGDLSLSECGRFIVGNVNDENLLDKAYYFAKANITPCDECDTYNVMGKQYKIF